MVRYFTVLLAIFLSFCVLGGPAWADNSESIYQQLLREAKQPNSTLFARLLNIDDTMDWQEAEQTAILGHLRVIKQAGTEKPLYMVRSQAGVLYILAKPKVPLNMAQAARYKMMFPLQVTTYRYQNNQFAIARLVGSPTRLLLDKIFFNSIVILLFLIMIGMGQTLTAADFAFIVRKPAGVVMGPLCQFGVLPLCGYLIGRFAGYDVSYPFIFTGIILVCCLPGGITSNVMTYLGRGDVALSVSMTAISTILSLVMVPLLLITYTNNIPQITVPVGDIVKTILFLVILPLLIGMLLRAIAPNYADRSERFFTRLGIISVFFIIFVGVWAHLDMFQDTQRYGVKFYLTVGPLPLIGMILGAVFAKLVGLDNYQARAISLETGIQNAAMAITMAILLQDRMGDYYSSMFFTSALYGIWMYVCGGLVIPLFPYLLPLSWE